MMMISFLRPVAASALVLTLAACAGTSDMQSATDANNDRISAAMDRAAGEAHRKGATEGSLVLLEKVYKRNPKSEEAAVKYARALRSSGELQKSLLILEPFAARDNVSADVLAEFATLQLNLSEFNSAETFARKAIAKDANAYYAYQVLGISLDAQNKYEDAEQAFRQALEIWQGDPIPVMNNLALNLTNQERLAEALEIMEQAKKAAPDRIEVDRNLRIIRTLNESASGRPAPKPAGKPATKSVTSDEKAPEKQAKVDSAPVDAVSATPLAPAPVDTTLPPALKADAPVVTSSSKPAGKAVPIVSEKPAAKDVPKVEPAAGQ